MSTNRITPKMLDEKARHISEVTGENYYVEWAYSRPRLVKQYGNTTGTSEVSPRLPSGQLHDWMSAFLTGIYTGMNKAKRVA